MGHGGGGDYPDPVQEQPVSVPYQAALTPAAATVDSRLVVDETGELVDPYDPGYMGTSSQAQNHIAAAQTRLDAMNTRNIATQQAQAQVQVRQSQDSHPLGRALGNGGHRQSAEELRAMMLAEEAEAERRVATTAANSTGMEEQEEDDDYDRDEEKGNIRPEEESQGEDYEVDEGRDLEDDFGMGDAMEGEAATPPAANGGDNRLQVERDMDRFFGISNTAAAKPAGGKKQGVAQKKTSAGGRGKGKATAKGGTKAASGRKGRGALPKIS